MANLYRILLILLPLAMLARYFEKGYMAAVLAVALILSLFLVLQRHKTAAPPAVSEKFRGFWRDPLLWLTGATLISWLYSSLTGINSAYSTEKFFQIVGVIIGGGILYVGVRQVPLMEIAKFPRWTLFLVLPFSLLVIVDMLQLFPRWTLATQEIDKLWQVPRIGHFSSILAMVAPFVWLMVLGKEKPRYWLIPTVMVTALFASGGRSGWLAFAVVTVMMLTLYPWQLLAKKAQQKWLFFGHIAVGAVAGILVYKTAIAAFFVSRMTLGSASGPGSGRLNIWEFAMQQFPENPWFGIGVKGFRHLDFSLAEKPLSSTMHPHNFVVELLLETGIIGTLLAAACVLVLLWRLGKIIYQNPAYQNPEFHKLAVACVVALFGFFTASLTLTSIFHAWWLTYFVIIIILLDTARAAILKQVLSRDSTAGRKITDDKWPVGVSVIMACHNGEKYLAEAVESVLAQRYQNWELIIANDGSSDGSLEMIKAYAAQDSRIRYLSQDHPSGVAPPKNRAIREAKGRYIALLDCDDIWYPEKLAVQIDFMEKTGAALSCTHYDVIDDDSVITGSFKPGRLNLTYHTILKANDIGCLTAVYDREVVGTMLLPELKMGSDLGLWLDMFQKIPTAACIHQTLAAYRIHSGQNTKNKRKAAMMRWRLFRHHVGLNIVTSSFYFCWYAVDGVLKVAGSLWRKYLPKP